MELFTLKKILGTFLMPLPICCLLLIVALFAFVIGKRKMGYVMTSAATLMLVVISTPTIPELLLRPLELRYNQYDLSEPVSTIVVLGCGHANDGRLPITSQLYDCSLARSIEALRIHKANPGSRLITSGTGFDEPFSNAEMNMRLLVALGVNENKITMVTTPKDTEDEAIAISSHVQQRPFALVTSASHMARAVRLFEQHGSQPIAAPTEHLVRQSSPRKWWYSLPRSTNINKSERWWYETLGQAWLTLKSWF